MDVFSTRRGLVKWETDKQSLCLVRQGLFQFNSKMEKISAERISQVINEKPFVFEVDIKKRNWLQKLLRQKKEVRIFSVTPPTLGTMIQIGVEIEKILGAKEMVERKDFASIFKHLAVNGEVVVNILALYMGGGLGLKQFIRNNITITEAANLLMKLIEFSRLEDFLTTIILTKGMSLTKTEEIIAPVPKDNLKTLHELLET